MYTHIHSPSVRPSTVCFPGTFPCEPSLSVTQFMHFTYPHQITALLDHICSSFSYCGAILQWQRKKFFKKKKANIYSWANAFPNLHDVPHCVRGNGLHRARWFLCVVAHLVRKNRIFPSHSVCSCDHTLVTFMVNWAQHWRPFKSIGALCIFSCKWYKLQQPFQSTTAGVFSPARIPLECREAPTKAPFTGGAAGEEPVQVMDREEKGTFFSTKRENEKPLCTNSCLLIIKHQYKSSDLGYNYLFSLLSFYVEIWNFGY